MADSVGRLVLRTLAWLPPCFAAWYVAGSWVVWPAYVASKAAVALAVGQWFVAVEQHGVVLTFVTRFHPDPLTLSGAASRGVVAFDVQALQYTFGVPMLAALTLAAREPGVARRLAWCFAALVPLQAWGMVADALQAVSGGLGASVSAQAGFTALQREAIALAYQFGQLMLPAVAPAVAWVIAHRRLLARLASPAPPAAT